MNLTLGEVKPAKLNEAVRCVHKKFPPVDAPEFENLEKRLSEFLERLKSEDWSGYKWSEASVLARDFFGSEFARETRWELIKNDFLSELSKERKSFVRGCFTGYLGGFKERANLTKELARALEAVDRSTLGTMLQFEKKFKALRPLGLPDRIVKDLIEHSQPYKKVKEYGVVAPHAFALFEDVFVTLVEQLKPKLRQDNQKAFLQIKNWLKPEDGYQMGAGSHLGVEAILSPFLKENPSSEVRKDILSFLVGTYGDPRIEPTKWVSVNQQYVEIVHRWLTGESLKTFFKIISKFDGSEMWEPRRVFWEEIFDKGWIKDAWPILNEDGVRYARELSAKEGKGNFLQFGRISGFNADKTCYFAMKIGQLLVVEGSHNFAIRFFKSGNRKSTPMYLKNYNRSELVIKEPPADKRITHKGEWQSKVNNYLRDNKEIW